MYAAPRLLICSWITICFIGLSAAASPDTFKTFQDPPKTYSPRPFWFWNGVLDSREVDRQIGEMVSQHVYGAYVHNRTGLQTPYLSDEYFSVVKSALESSKKRGFLFGFIDEYEWPGGEARDPWRPGLGSRVIDKNPDFRMRSLWFASKDSTAAGLVEISGLKNVQFAVAAKLTGGDKLDPESLTLVSAEATSVKWTAPSAGWRLMAYYLEPSQGRDGGLVDLLNGDAIKTWLGEVHEKYYALGPEHFGTTIDSIYTDHEGDYGRRIAWTPRLFETFQKMKGYDARKLFPALSFETGKLTPKLRCDYMDVISELYVQNYMQQVTDWCDRHNVKISGHLWEENLISEAFSVGDLQRAMRAWSWPGVDSLYDIGRSPRDLKATASVAHFRGTRFAVENQGVQGNESYLDLQKMRLGTNMLGVWGTSLFVPHAFNYNASRIEYPSDWFFHQPYWKYFSYYADYARRIAYMNDGGRHHADILLFQPTETAWANSDPNYSPKPDWNATLLPMINRVFGDLMNRMSQELRDYDVADSFYLDKAVLEGNSLRIGNESFRVLVLPPVTVMRRATMRKIVEFYDRGGVVIGVKMLPTDSMEEGRNDPEIAAAVKHIFSGNRKAYFIKDKIEELFPVLDASLARDVELAGGTRQHWGALHREKDGLQFYWLVNDSATPRDQTFRLSVKGVPEKWDAATGAREALESRSMGDRTEVKLHFEPWDAFYVVFGNPDARVKEPVKPYPALAPLVADGAWTIRPEKQTIAAPYAVRNTSTWDGLGETRGYAEKKYDDERWQREWLSRERMTVRNWWLVGPFPNEDHEGCFKSFPPEKEPDPKASYGDLRWRRYNSQAMSVDLYSALGMNPGLNGTAYALTYVYSAKPRKAYFRVAANNNAHLWVNGKKLLDWHLHPWYYEMREDFALTREAELQAGWNPVLVKVSRFRRGNFAFMVRITDENGDNIEDLVVNPDKTIPGAGSTWVKYWYRIPVPATSVQVTLPRFRRPYTAWYNGEELRVDPAGCAQFPAPAEGADNVLALEIGADDEIRSSPVFTLASAKTQIGSWLDNGLPYYSGTAVYETEVQIPAEYLGRQLTLDCGEVGVAAEVRVNGQAAGVRVWLPYTFDITSLAKAGTNRIQIAVTNTMENERAVENRAMKLARLKHSGLIGPVRIVAGAPVR